MAKKSKKYYVTKAVKSEISKEIPGISWETDGWNKPGGYYGWESLNVARIYTIDGAQYFEVYGSKTVSFSEIDDFFNSLPENATVDVYASIRSYRYSLEIPKAKSADQIRERLQKSFSYGCSYRYYHLLDEATLEKVKESDKAVNERMKKAEENYERKLERDARRREAELERQQKLNELSNAELTVAQALKVLKKAGVTVKIDGEM